MLTQAYSREFVENALTRHFQDLEQVNRQSRTSGSSNTTLSEQFNADVAYLRNLVPEYTCRFNRCQSNLLRLPPEILPDILHWVILQSAQDEYQTLREWLYLGHICHDLRVALLGMHAAWANVVFDHRYRRAQDELLDRAGCFPIIVQLHGNESRKYVDRAFELLPRAREIDVWLYGPAKVLIQALRQGDYLLLEMLSVVQCGGSPVSIQEDLSALVDNPALTTPKLRVLKLYDIFIPVDMSSLHSLTLMWNLTGTPIPVYGARALGDMLRRCVRLQRLEMRNWISDCVGLQGLGRSGYNISLPHLNHLRLSQGMEHIFALWEILSIPVSATIRVDFTSDELYDLRGLQALSGNLRGFVSHTMEAGVSKISKINVAFSNAYQLEVSLDSSGSSLLSEPSTRSREVHPTPWASWESSTFIFSAETSIAEQEDVMSFLACLCSSLRLNVDNIDTLELSREYENDAFTNDRILDPHLLCMLFPAISTLQLQGIDWEISRLLNSSNPQTPAHLPCLQALHICRQTCTDSTFSAAYIEDIIDAVQRRIDQGIPLRILTLDGWFPKHFFDAEAPEGHALRRLGALVTHFDFGSKSF